MCHPQPSPSGNVPLELFQTLGLLPPSGDAAGAFDRALPPVQALLVLWSDWRRRAPRRSHSRAARVCAWIQASMDQGAELTWTTLGAGQSGDREQEPRHILWWSQGIPRGPLAGIAGSRFGRDPDIRQSVAESIRYACRTATQAGAVVMTSAGTPVEPLVAACCDVEGLNLLTIHAPGELPRARPSSGNWLDRLMRRHQPGRSRPRQWHVFVSPETVESSPSPEKGFQLRDRCLACLANELWMVTLRSGGVWDRLVETGLSLADRTGQRINLIHNAPLPDESSMRLHESRGAAVRRLPIEEKPGVQPTRVQVQAPGPQPSDEPGSHRRKEVLNHFRQTDAGKGRWLVHWTRDAWTFRAGEAQGAADRELFQPGTQIDRSAPGTLSRILSEQRLRASAAAIRGGHAVVSFSAVPLMELASRRVFRAHRGRWDFEHYGICVSISRLAAAGARPVIYGDEADWRHLPEPERPWFQRKFTHTARGEIDWSAEAEWRLKGDFDLSCCGPDELVVFCRTRNEVPDLSSTLLWPVISIEELIEASDISGKSPY